MMGKIYFSDKKPSNSIQEIKKSIDFVTDAKKEKEFVTTIKNLAHM